MKTEKFFEIFTDLDDDLIENAFPKAQEPEIVHPAERIRLWKPFTAAAALVVLACGVTVAGMKLHSLRSRTPADSNPLSSNTVNSQSETDPNISDDFIKTLNSVIDSAADVEALNSGIKSADEDVLIAAIQVFESPAAFEKNTILSAGELENGMIVLVDFIDGTHYITSRSEQTRENIPAFMFESIIRRADSVEQLAAEIDGYNRGLGDKKLTSVSLYKNYDDARSGDVSGEPIIENGKLVASDSIWKNGGAVRVTYEGGVSWFCFTIDNHSEQVSVMHNDQGMSLSDWQYTTLSDTVLQTVTTECLPDFQLQMDLSDQRIKEYGKNGFVITIQYQPTYGESSDKMARGICSVTVLIGADGEPSYITYSYIVSPLSGNSEQQDGGIYYLSDSSRNSILQILDINSGNSDDAVSIGINSNVMWGMGKTFDEISAKYGSATAGNDKAYTFKNGYGIYVWDDGDCCKTIGEITARDLLVGDLSTLDLDNFASKCGFEVVPLNSTDDPNTMYEGYKCAYYTHPSHKNITFIMRYKESGFDEEATFRISYDGSDHANPDNDETSSPPTPNVYFNTKPADYALAKEQVSFTDVKEVSGTGFVGYELEYVMPSETLVSLNYIFTDGKISVIDNSAGIGAIQISSEDEEIKRGEMSFWKIAQNRTVVVYISESNIAYYSEFEPDVDTSQAINRIISIL